MRGTTFTDVTFRGCDLRDVDASGARWTRVRFEDCRTGHLDVTGARLQDVDLTACELEAVSGVGDLRGAVVSEVQLALLAPLLAAHLGVRVAG
nr:pentapeptide repeat-containing protein [Kineococcus vitellinus]